MFALSVGAVCRLRHATAGPTKRKRCWRALTAPAVIADALLLRLTHTQRLAKGRLRAREQLGCVRQRHAGRLCWRHGAPAWPGRQGEHVAGGATPGMLRATPWRQAGLGIRRGGWGHHGGRCSRHKTRSAGGREQDDAGKHRGAARQVGVGIRRGEPSWSSITATDAVGAKPALRMRESRTTYCGEESRQSGCSRAAAMLRGPC